MRKRKIKIIPCLIFACIILIFIVILGSLLIYNYNISSVSKKSEEITFNVEENETFLSLADDLKKENLIKSEFFYKIYIKLNSPKKLEKGVYILNRNMSLKEIVNTLDNGSNYNDNITITFNEGINMRKVISLITEKTSIKEDEILNKLKDNDYLDTLIVKYWFLTSDIKNEDIYYSLEGYLYPDTYEFKKDTTIEEIFKIMLDNTEKKLEPYKTSLTTNKYTVHQLLTLASIVELESVGDDRSGVAGVFYNRLNSNWALGSDVTTYYGIKVDINERDLYKDEINAYNAYNTRSSKMAGKLPVGPICNPSVLSIEAVLNPTKSDYFYFVADKNKKTYYSKTYNGHLNTIAKLKSEGLWYEY
jgi:UPF0755 protein